MNILVNGASGYIGGYLTRELLDNGHNVFAVCRSHIGSLGSVCKHPNLHIIVCKQSELLRNIYDCKIDVWYHLLWEGANGKLRADPQVQINNELLAVQAVYTAVNIGCPKIIFTGTVYEKMADTILKDVAFSRNSFYIICKHHTHDITYQMSKNNNIDYIWCQFCHPIGIGMNSQQMIPSIIEAFTNNNDIDFGKCDQPYDIFSVRNLAKAFRLLGENNNKKHFYYIGSGRPRMLKDYISEVAAICNYQKKLVFGKRKDDGMRYKEEWFDSTEFRNEFGDYDVESFADVIKKMYELRQARQYE